MTAKGHMKGFLRMQSGNSSGVTLGRRRVRFQAWDGLVDMIPRLPNLVGKAGQSHRFNW